MTFSSFKRLKLTIAVAFAAILITPLFAHALDIVDPLTKWHWQNNPIEKKAGCMLFSSESVCKEDSESEGGAAAKYTGHEDPTQCVEIQAKIGKLAAALDQVALELKSARNSLTSAKNLLGSIQLTNRQNTVATSTTNNIPVTSSVTSTSTGSSSVKANAAEGDMVLTIVPGQVRVGESVSIQGKINSNTTYYNLEIYKDSKLFATLLSNTFIPVGTRPFLFQRNYITSSMPVGTYQVKLSDTYLKNVYTVANVEVLPKTTLITNTAAKNSYQYVGPAGSTLSAVKTTVPVATNYLTFTKPFIGAQVQANRGFVISWVFTGNKTKKIDIYADASCDASGSCAIGSNTRILVAKNIKVSDRGYAWWVPTSLVGKKVRLYAEQGGQPAGTGQFFTVVKSIFY